ncbi:MAG: shikimate kinase [Candidatus Methylomirabilaceae bacterium]
MRIVLTGFMGTGKTVVGRRLAERLGLAFIDLDDLIQEEAGMGIPEIFASEGEAGFRRRERALIAAIAKRDDVVLATGGGAVLDPENVRRFKTEGILVCLQAEPQTILERIGGDAGRPLLQASDWMARIRALLEQRATAYATADLTVETSRLDVDEIVDRIVSHLRLEPAVKADTTP